MPKFYGRSDWAPKLIFLQIVCLQCSHYLALGLLLALFHGRDISLEQFFSYKVPAFESVHGLQTSSAHALGGLCSALFLCLIVERAKKCLDFGVTLFFIDFVACCCYGGFPSTWSWWIVHLLSMAITIVLGEYLCSLRELEEIPMLDLFRPKASSSSGSSSTYLPVSTQEKHS
ncbi:Integral membrane protein of the Golgi [Aphanomyces cochlioides]|nr:Integral membrane protein of the Golgi [Aphanomyces cochlioides]